MHIVIFRLAIVIIIAGINTRIIPYFPYSQSHYPDSGIRWNRNGIFEPAEKLGEANNISPMPATATITFPVPSDATVGIVRLRVREVWYNTGIDPCNNYNYGEAEDYNVHI
ncbi:MAG: GEVED domain-containing protein, partial [Bacteroidales bacterium]